MTWYVRLAGWWVRIASIARRIVAGSGSRRTSKAALFVGRPCVGVAAGGGGHGSAGMMPRSTARRTHARATLRYRPAVDGASGWPSRPRAEAPIDGGEVARVSARTAVGTICASHRSHVVVRSVAVGDRDACGGAAECRRGDRRRHRYGERDEAGQRFDRRRSGPGLPLLPLLGEPPARPLGDRDVGGRRRPRQRLAGRAVEPLAAVVRRPAARIGTARRGPWS